MYFIYLHVLAFLGFIGSLVYLLWNLLKDLGAVGVLKFILLPFLMYY